MKAEEFARAKSRIMRRYPRATSRQLSGTMLEISQLVGANDVLTAGSVAKTGDLKCMVTAHYRPATRQMTADQVAQELERVWREDIAIGVEVHLVTRSEAQVGLEFVMVDNADRTYQTGEIVVDMTNPGPIERRTKAGRHRVR